MYFNYCSFIMIINNKFATFLNQLSSFLFHAATTPLEFIITGDFNIHGDDLIDTQTIQFFYLLASCNLTQHIKIPTHKYGQTLNLIITLANTTINPVITSSYIFTSYHYPIFTTINARPNPSPHQQPSPIAASTPLTIPDLSMTSTQVLSLRTLSAPCPCYSTHISQPFAHYLIITPLSSPKPINSLAMLQLFGLPLKFSVSRPPVAA